MAHTPRTTAAITVLVLTLTGCTHTPAAALETLHVTIGTDTALTVEHARTVEEQRTGLSGRDSLPADTGMLFTFDPAGSQRIWMAGMRFPIDIAWIRDGRIIATDTLPACTAKNTEDCPRWDSLGDVDALLETTAGTLKGATAGTTITTTRTAE